MRYAKNIQGHKKEVSFSGEKAKCLDCLQEVRGHKGKIKIPYWQHTNKKNCDTWYEPITRWHIDWQNKFEKEFQEITLFDSEKNEYHRADIRTKSGLVVEIQNSPIKPEEIEQRENFYGKHKLLWILNGENLLKHCILNFNFEKKDTSLTFEIPYYLDDLSEYDFQSFLEYFYESNTFKEITNQPNFVDYENQNGNYFIFHFINNKDFDSIEYSLKSETRIFLKNFLTDNQYEKYLDQFIVNQNNITKDRYTNVNLNKKYWRPFINLMKHPVFIDNLRGLDTDSIYYYQKNVIIKKHEFIINIEKNW